MQYVKQNHMISERDHIPKVTVQRGETHFSKADSSREKYQNMFIYYEAQMRDLKNTLFFSWLTYCIHWEAVNYSAESQPSQHGFGRHFTFTSYTFKQKNPLASPLAYTQLHLYILHSSWGAPTSHGTLLSGEKSARLLCCFLVRQGFSFLWVLLFPFCYFMSWGTEEQQLPFIVFLCWLWGVVFMLHAYKTIIRREMF